MLSTVMCKNLMKKLMRGKSSTCNSYVIVTHNDILKRYKLFDILKIFSSVTWQKIFLKYIKRSYFYSKNNFCIMKKIKPVCAKYILQLKHEL